MNSEDEMSSAGANDSVGTILGKSWTLWSLELPSSSEYSVKALTALLWNQDIYCEKVEILITV